MPVSWPSEHSRWRCSLCGNLTRFDVTRSSRVREFVHLELSGEPRIEETQVLSGEIEQVRCRWCNAADSVEIVPRAGVESAENGKCRLVHRVRLFEHGVAF